MRIQSVKRFAIGFATVLLLVAGYYWVQSAQETVATANQPAIAPADTTLTVIKLDSAAVNVPVAKLKTTPKKPAAAPRRTPTTETEPLTDQLTTAENQKSVPEETIAKPAPVRCDQVVMRNGDLTDAKILAVGVDEIRYKRCHRDDGPEYVVSKSDVLSIRYANGDIDRF